MKEKIKRELISHDLNKLIKALWVFIIMIGIFGYIGYTYAIDNNEDIGHCIVLGCLFPLGIMVIKYLEHGNIFTYIVYMIGYLFIADYISTFVGIIILSVIIAMFICWFIYIEKKDRTDEIERKHYEKRLDKQRTIKKNIPIQKNIDNIIKKDIYNNSLDESNEYFENDEEEFECEMCFKKISEEEYELYDCFCEECFIDVHTDENGQFHSDIFFY